MISKASLWGRGHRSSAVPQDSAASSAAVQDGTGLQCQTHKVFKIFMWRRNLGKLAYLDLDRVEQSTQQVYSLFRALAGGKTWGSFPSG